MLHVCQKIELFTEYASSLYILAPTKRTSESLHGKPLNSVTYACLIEDAALQRQKLCSHNPQVEIAQMISEALTSHVLVETQGDR